MARRTAEEREADRAEARAAGSPDKAAYLEGRAHCIKLGIDPDSISDALRQLARKFKRGPLEILWRLADDDSAGKSARASAAMAILPYLHGKPKEAKAAPPGQASGVMEVPIAQSMEEWMTIARASQASLKASVRE